jgi:tetratricopeptide (TPR) repeat protein
MQRYSEDRARSTARVAETLVVFCCVFATTVLSQQLPTSLDTTPQGLNRYFVPVYTTAPGTGILVFTVFAENSRTHLDRQALLKMVNLENQAASWQTTEEDSRGAFTNIRFGNYDVEISAVGYLSEHKQMYVTTSEVNKFEIVLHRDPAAIALDVDDHALSPKARKEAKRAVSALKSRNFTDARNHLDQAYKLAPSSSELNFLLGYLCFQQKEYAKASEYLGTATTLSPRNAQALTLLGRSNLERSDYPAAQLALERAVAADSENWQPHNLLANAYFHEKNYDKARDEAQAAIAKGKTEASPALLVLGQALINLGSDQQGINALETFLHESPSHPMAGQVRTLIAEVREHASVVPSAENAAAQTLPRLSGVDPLQAVSAPGLSVRSWQPAGLDQSKLSLASGVDCPAETVLDETGKRVAELVDDIARFAAVEDLFHQSLDVFGNPLRTETRKYNYVASISEPEAGYLSVDEDRAAKADLTTFPDKIASTGFAALALVFHPHMRDAFGMKCEGLGDWHGQAIWVVDFKQRDDKPNRLQSYKIGNMVYPVKLKGRAWITADHYQIVHIESEMVRPMPEIRLLSEHQIVEYGPVRFEKKNMSLWLPKSAEIYFDFRQHRYYRRHSFGHYMLFSVDTDEKRKEPVSTPASQPSSVRPG